ncbi:unnamed protein product, partial [Rotaria sp. Silwood1]
MTSSTILNLKTPSQDAQGCWYETLSPTQVLTGQQQQQQPVKPQNDEQMKQKKKCRGNRKAQRLRRRLRQQRLDPDTITELVNQKINLQRRQQHDEAIQYNRIPQSAQHKNNYQDTVVKKAVKRKRNDTPTKTSSATIDKSLSQLSISQPSSTNKRWQIIKLNKTCIKIWAAMNSLNYTYGRSKTLIVQRLQTIQRQLQQASQALQ